MSQRSVFYLILFVLGAMAIVLFINIQTVFSGTKYERYLSFNNVRGIDLEHEGLLYTLNFDQQNAMITHINASLPIGKYAPVRVEKFPFSKMIIYQFKGPDLVLTPVSYDGVEWVYAIPELNKDGFFQDISHGNMNNVITESYDPS